MLCEHGNVSPCVECDVAPLKAENEALRARVAQLSEALQVAVDTPELGGGTWYDMAVAALAEQAGR